MKKTSTIIKGEFCCKSQKVYINDSDFSLCRVQRRTDIARVGVRRGPHVDARDDAHRKEHRDERAAAVGEERKRGAYQRTAGTG